MNPISATLINEIDYIRKCFGSDVRLAHAELRQKSDADETATTRQRLLFFNGQRPHRTTEPLAVSWMGNNNNNNNITEESEVLYHTALRELYAGISATELPP